MFVQAPLGVILKNENRLEEMVEILQDLQRYIPIASTEGGKKTSFHQVIFGGDQLTAKRARSAIRIRDNSISDVDRLQGFVPASEDWHTKVVFLEVSSSNNIVMCNYLL